MIGRISDALHLPLSTRNQMLTHAGFAARYQETNWDAEEMAVIRHALDHTLTNHNPYPAFAIDRLWNIIQLNRTAERLFGILGVSAGGSLLELILSPAVQTAIENWPVVAQHVVQRLRTESSAQGGVRELDEVANVLAETVTPDNTEFGPMIPTNYRVGDLQLSLFSTIAQFGTPVDLTLDDLKIELFFPADDATAETLRALDNSS